MIWILCGGIMWMACAILFFEEDYVWFAGLPGSAAFLFGFWGIVLQHVTISLH